MFNNCEVEKKWYSEYPGFDNPHDHNILAADAGGTPWTDDQTNPE
jgi:hypothetical protein